MDGKLWYSPLVNFNDLAECGLPIKIITSAFRCVKSSACQDCMPLEQAPSSTRSCSAGTGGL
jgi:hypothetical protein